MSPGNLESDPTPVFQLDLPALALQVIGSFLPQRAALTCRLVSKQWKAAFTTCIDHLYIPVDLQPSRTDGAVSAAAAAFPFATTATLLLPNTLHAPCNPFGPAGDAPMVVYVPLGRRSAAANAARLADFLRSQQSASHPPSQLPPPPAVTLEPKDLGPPACAAALAAVRRHIPSLAALHIGTAERPHPRPGPLAALAHCLPYNTAVCPVMHASTDKAAPASARASSLAAAACGPNAATGSRDACMPSTKPAYPLGLCEVHAKDAAEADTVAGNDDDGEYVQIHAAKSVATAAAPFAYMWCYPACLVPMEGAVCWQPQPLQQEAVQYAAELAIVRAYRQPLDLEPLTMPSIPPSAPLMHSHEHDGVLADGSAAMVAIDQGLSRLAALDVRCIATLSRKHLPAALTGLTVLQLRDGTPLGELTHLSSLASLDLWCNDGIGRTDATYWTSGAPLRIARGLPQLAAALTGLTAIVLRELSAQVEPPPPLGSLAALPGLRSLTVELVFGDVWRELRELYEQLEEEDGEEEEEGEEEQSSSDGEEEEGEDAEGVTEEEEGSGGVEREGRAVTEAQVADLRARREWEGPGVDAACQQETMRQQRQRLIAHYVALLNGGGGGGGGGGEGRGSDLRAVLRHGASTLGDMQPLDLFSCFASDSPQPTTQSPEGPSGVGAARGGGSLTHLDVTLVGCGLLPGLWHGITALGPSLTRLALRVGRNRVEERLVSLLLEEATPGTAGCGGGGGSDAAAGGSGGLWQEDAFAVDCLGALPHLTELVLDAPLTLTLAARLAARSLGCVAAQGGLVAGGVTPPVQEQQHQQQGHQGVLVLPLVRRLSVLGLPALATMVAAHDGLVATSAAHVAAASADMAAGARRSTDVQPSEAPPLAAETPPPPPLLPSPAFRPTLLHALHLDGDLRGLMRDLASGALAATEPASSSRFLVELRLAHRPAGRPSTRLLPLLWSYLPAGLQTLQLEGFEVACGRAGGADGDGISDWTTLAPTHWPCPTSVTAAITATAVNDAARSPHVPLRRLAILRLRHCAAALSGLHRSPLMELSVQGCWLASEQPPCAGPGSAPAGALPSTAIATAPGVLTTPSGVLWVGPWDAEGQWLLLRGQPWAARLTRLKLQLAASPERDISWVVGSGVEGHLEDTIDVPEGTKLAFGDDGMDERLGPQDGQEDSCGSGGLQTNDEIRAFLRLENLSVTWELAALVPRRHTSQPSNVGGHPRGHQGTPRGTEEETHRKQCPPGVGLLPSVAATWVLPLSRLRSLELYLGEVPTGPGMRMEDLLWLMRCGTLRRLRVVLCVGAAARYIGYGSAKARGKGCEGREHGAVGHGHGQQSTQPGAQLAMEEGGTPEQDVSGGSSSSDYHFSDVQANKSPAGASSSVRGSAVAPPVSAWLHSELADLMLRGRPYCQTQVTQIRLK